MFNKYNERSRQTLMYAQEAARNFNHGYIGTEHILLGIIKEGGTASKVLNDMKVTIVEIQDKIKVIVGYGDSNLYLDEILLTPRAKKLVELSDVEARKIYSSVVTPEHMLLALIKVEDGIGYTMLYNMGINFNELMEKLSKSYVVSETQNNDYFDYKVNNSTSVESSTEKIKTYNTPILDKYGKDLTECARIGKLDPLIGREMYSDRVMEVLCRRLKNNPCLIGEPGVGKTAIVEGLAQKIQLGSVPSILKGKRLVCVDMVSMVAGAKYRGDFEDRLKSLIDEVIKYQDIILFIDEIHTIVGAGGAEGAIDASNILKPALARGELQCIGATTIDEYKKYIERDAALERRFHPVIIDEPSKEETLKILEGLRERYEEYHEVTITDEALKAAVELTHRYLPDRYLPDKAIDVMDEASARKKILQTITSATKTELLLQDIVRPVVDDDDIAATLSTWTKIPIEKINLNDVEKLLNLDEILRRRVVGQDEAVEAIVRAVKRSRVGFRDGKRPIGSFIFLGPTGVGKTELSKALAEAIFSDEKSIVKIDMTEYMEKHSVSKLIGSPPGYIGFEEGGQLTERVRRNPYSVVLFDEIEKAHPDVFNILLQILEEGKLTDSKGRAIDFKNTIIIMTSNAGTSTIKKQESIGFGVESNNKNSDEYIKMKENILKSMKSIFKPELINRIDDIVVFRKLSEKDLFKVTNLMIDDLCLRAKENDIELRISKTARAFLSKQGESNIYGARPLRRAIQTMIEDKLYDYILKGEFSRYDLINIDFINNELFFEKSN